MQLGIACRNDIRLQRFLKRQVACTEKSLIAATKYLHKSMRHAIRISPNASKPGQPMHSRAGLMKNAVASVANIGKMEAKVGIGDDVHSPKRLSEIASIHEYGGKRLYSPYKVGDYGPVELAGRAKVRKVKGRARSIWEKRGAIFSHLYSPRQAAKATRLANQIRRSPGGVASYPQRSFAASTLKKAFPYILKKFFTRHIRPI